MVKLLLRLFGEIGHPCVLNETKTVDSENEIKHARAFFAATTATHIEDTYTKKRPKTRNQRTGLLVLENSASTRPHGRLQAYPTQNEKKSRQKFHRKCQDLDHGRMGTQGRCKLGVEFAEGTLQATRSSDARVGSNRRNRGCLALGSSSSGSRKKITYSPCPHAHDLATKGVSAQSTPKLRSSTSIVRCAHDSWPPFVKRELFFH